jgi:Mg2+/Co2+ transporter CorB
MSLLGFVILALILISGFFSASETSMMALNRYRLKNRAKKSRAARRAIKLLERPDRLLATILVGNTFANILASSVMTIVAAHYFGNVGVAVSTICLTLIIILFAEIMPKTFAAIEPERLAMPATGILTFLQRLVYPLVWFLNVITNNILKIFGVRVGYRKLADPLTAEELKGVVHASSEHIRAHKNMLLGVLDLELATVKDAMLPRQSIYGINLDDPWQEIYAKICNSPYSKLPVYREDINHVVGYLAIKKLINVGLEHKDPHEELEKLVSPPYFIPETTSLQKQLSNFQKSAEHMALVVDEYGDIQGLVTVEDILEEIVGDFASFDQHSPHTRTQKLENGSYIVDGGMTLRDLHRDLGLNLPTGAMKTLSGLIVTYLDKIPDLHTRVEIAGYLMEVLSVDETSIQSVRIYPKS